MEENSKNNNQVASILAHDRTGKEEIVVHIHIGHQEVNAEMCNEKSVLLCHYIRLFRFIFFSLRTSRKIGLAQSFEQL